MTALRKFSSSHHDRNRTTVEPLADEQTRSRHDFDRVEERDDGFVLRCTCGWTSRASRSAEAVGTAWDRHRSEVGASDW